jgi:cyclophilin family peptidyl-prolyl cis-trans isomerase
MRNRTALFTRQYPRHSNSRGTISYAMGGPGTRSCQLFINLVDNKFLDAQGFTPIARIVYGALGTKNAVSDSPGDVNIIDRIYNGYGEGGKGDGSDGKGELRSICTGLFRYAAHALIV